MAKHRTGDSARRAAVAFELRSQGKTYGEIAAELGCSASTAVTAVREGVRQSLESHGRDEQVALVLSDLDEMAAILRPKWTAGDLDALDRALKVQARRSRLLGLDAPTKTVNSNTNTEVVVYSTDQIAGEIARLEAELAAGRSRAEEDAED